MRVWPTQRFMLLTHVKELIAQNVEALFEIWPNAPVGIYSAGLKSRDIAYPIIYAGIQSAIKNPMVFGHRDIIFIDECHLVNQDESSQYQTFLAAMKLINPNVKIIGMSATPFRMGLGYVTDGSIFTDIIHDITNLDNFNRLISEGYLSPPPASIDTDIHVYPNAELLVNALSKCTEQYSITQLDQDRLSIKSNKFKAIVPCLNPEMMAPTYPDPAVVSLDNRFREALSAVAVLVQEGAQQVYLASVLLNGASLIATTGKVILEAWGGWDLPCGIGLPKTFATALSKISKNISKFGCSKNSVTVWFEDESWLRTQIFAEPWPDVGENIKWSS